VSGPLFQGVSVVCMSKVGDSIIFIVGVRKKMQGEVSTAVV
jgi:hypothetical protein